MKQIAKIKLPLMLATLSLLVLPLTLVAQELTQGYASDELLLRGHVVGLVEGDTSKVQTITNERREEALGVVVRPIDTALTLTDEQTGVFVVNNGKFEVLFSDINGDVQVNDYVSVSSISGIAMKADPRQPFVVGRALEASNFGDPNNVLSQPTVIGPDGLETEVAIGRILVDLDIKPNPFAADSSAAPEFLVSISQDIAGKPVSALRIYAGLAIILLASTISGTLLYSAVKSSIISIGRNPLSKKSVLAGLAQVVIISVIIFLSGLFAVYLILKI